MRTHWHNLRIAAARRSAFEAESWSLRRLSNTRECRPIEVRAERLREAHRRRRFALAERRRRDADDHDVAAVVARSEAPQHRDGDFSLSLAVRFEFVGTQTDFSGKLKA